MTGALCSTTYDVFKSNRYVTSTTYAFIALLVALSTTRIVATESVRGQARNVSTGAGTFSPSSALNRPLSRTNPRVLLLSQAFGFVHDSIPSTVEMMRVTANARNWSLAIPHTVDEYVHLGGALHNFDVVVFLLTTGLLFNDSQRTAFRTYMDAGGSMVGVHSATDTCKDWPYFLETLGASFRNHPRIQRGLIRTTSGNHSSTAFLPSTWVVEDEFYNFAKPMRTDNMKVLLSVDERSYEGGTHGKEHPLSWSRKYVPGVFWYTALGHRSEVYNVRRNASSTSPERRFERHLTLGIEWAAQGSDLSRSRRQTHTLRSVQAHDHHPLSRQTSYNAVENATTENAELYAT